MTRRLDRESPALEFRARVLRLRAGTAEEGEAQTGMEHDWLELDASAFYPGGGGQSPDGGTLSWPGGCVAVETVTKDESGAVWHRLGPGPRPEVGTELRGEVDAARRARHSQRHSAEHLLAQALWRVNRVFEVRAVGLLSPECTIDLAGQPSEGHLRAAETLLRETLGRVPLRLETFEVPEAELGAYPLRRPPQVSGTVRLVAFRAPDGELFDVSACGGTHVPFAAMCGPVVIVRSERRRDLTRVTFRAGEEAAEFLAEQAELTRHLSQSFSTGPAQLSGRIAALREEAALARAEAESRRADLARSLLAAALTHTGPGWTWRAVEVPDAELLRPVLGQTLAPAGGEAGAQPGVIAALAPDGRCGIGSAHPALDAGQALRAILARTGGQGGGRPDFAQGRCEQPEGFWAAARGVLGTPG